jgi:hypothetical protein
MAWNCSWLEDLPVTRLPCRYAAGLKARQQFFHNELGFPKASHPLYELLYAMFRLGKCIFVLKSLKDPLYS